MRVPCRRLAAVVGGIVAALDAIHPSLHPRGARVDDGARVARRASAVVLLDIVSI
jgi:hypothetical protein